MALNVSLEFGDYFENYNEVFYLLDHDDEKKTIQLQHVREDVEVTLKYTGEYPNCQYQVKIAGKDYEQIIKRCEVMWRTTPPISFEDCLNQLDQFFKDHRRMKREMNTREYREKELARKLDEKFKEICEKEGNTVFSFNRDVGYANLKRDIIEAEFKQDEYGFRIEAINGNPYHWKVQFFGFDPSSHIGQDIEHMMDISMQETIDLELTFSTMMFPVVPPKYDFIVPKLHSHTLEKIFHSGAFEKDVYNPLTKIDFLKNIRQVIERYAQIDFGIEYNRIEDYLNEKNRREQQLCKPLLGQLIERGKEYVENEIAKQSSLQKQSYRGYSYANNGYGMLQTSNSIQFNSYLLEHCDAYKRFIGMLDKMGFNGVLESGFFCWHGSDDTAIQSICQTGFNPGKRGSSVGQAFGRGEYFGKTPDISMGYCKGCCHLILTYILTNKDTNKQNPHNNGIIVVENPANWETSYCLPLLVITFGNGRPVNFLEKAMN